MEALSRSFPAGIAYSIPFDTTKFVSASIDEVFKTLIEAAMLVLVVILMFLQDWRAMMVPATTVPITIIGVFSAMRREATSTSRAESICVSTACMTSA